MPAPGPHWRRWLAPLLALLLLPAACTDYTADIEAVKAAPSVTGGSNEALLNQIAGARGKVEWSAGPAEAYPDNDAIVAVEGRIERTTRTGQRRVILFEYIHNRETSQVALERMLVDGRPQTLLTSALNLMLLELE